jgi:general secretion pathway protein D
MSLEISSVTGEQTVDGVTEPTIGQRRIEHSARLADGEVNLIGGILEDTETNSLSGYPLLSRIPILRYLFSQTNKERQQSEIVFAITPHVIRGTGVTDDDTRVLDVGTADSVSYHPRTDAATPTLPASAPAPALNQQKQPPVTAPHAQKTSPVKPPVAAPS